MKIAFERRAHRNEVQRKLNEDKVDIDADALNLKTTTDRNRTLEQIRLNFAASRAQGLVRGYLVRCRFADLKAQLRATITIQRVARGKLGRLKWKRVYWWKLAVVKSEEALKDLIKRSRVIREAKNEGASPPYQWQECFDPMTNFFWYLNRASMLTTWECPVPLQKELVCTWDDVRYAAFRSATAAVLTQHDEGITRKCRCVFKTVIEYQRHIQNFHRWFCPSCEYKNWGACFPVCTLCGSSTGDEGEDGSEVLKESVDNVRKKLEAFLKEDKTNATSDKYTLKDRIIQVADERRERIEQFGSFDDEDIEWDPLQPHEIRRYQEHLVSQEKRTLENGKYGSTLAMSLVNSLVKPLQLVEQGVTTTQLLPLLHGYSVSSGAAAAITQQQQKEYGVLQRSDSIASMSSIGSAGTTAGAGGKKRVTISEQKERNRDGNNNQNKNIITVNDTTSPLRGGAAALSHSSSSSRSVVSLPEIGSNHRPRQTASSSSSLYSATSRDDDNLSVASSSASSTMSLAMSSLTIKSSLKKTKGGGYNIDDGNMMMIRSMDSSTLPPPPTTALQRGGPLRPRNVPLPAEPMFSRKDDVEDFVLKQQEEAKRRKRAKELLAQHRKHEAQDVCLPASYLTVTTQAYSQSINDKGGLAMAETDPFADPLGKGVLFREEFDGAIDDFIAISTEQADMRAAFLRAQRKAMKDMLSQGGLQEEDEPEDDDDDGDDDHPPAGLGGDFSADGYTWLDSTNYMRMLVCKRFLMGRCTKTTCPMAHPGIRDSATITLAIPPGMHRKMSLVRVCEDFDAFCDNCSDGKLCKKYHIYVRPSTREIIMKIYPMEQGVRDREFPSGAKIRCNTKEKQFNGYGVMTWPSKAVYMGDWVEGLRQGLGIFKGADGVEYVGGWENGMRHGRGVLTTVNGDEYAGDWVAGKMEGYGRLSSSNGDVYEGGFHNNKYHGICSFRKSSGDKYIGYCVDGMATGTGILALHNGEKYKGNFDRNFRHGRGVCAYKNGSRYAGEWYRGQPQGFGIYLSPIGEKYIGQWASGKKHDKGRYYFISGDFYDGEFHKDKAKGHGVYYHANGNIYVGNWENDKRNGRGTYVWNTDSKYTGFWVDNEIHGKGKLDYGNGCFYRGEFDHSTKHGKGIFTWPNRTEYKGSFDRDVIRGIGECKYWNDHRYVGQWENNKKNGKGTFYYNKGHMYEGDWKDDIRQGKGKMTWLPGSLIQESYEGDWDNDEKHGKGRYIYRDDDGTVYEGDWLRGIRHGKGRITFKDGSYYHGDFQKEQMWGRGTYVGADGSQYTGEWRSNMRHGIGTTIYRDGTIFRGEFRMNMKHGSGHITDKDKGVFTGKWEGNIPIGKGSYKLICGDGVAGGPKEISVKVLAL